MSTSPFLRSTVSSLLSPLYFLLSLLLSPLYFLLSTFFARRTGYVSLEHQVSHRARQTAISGCGHAAQPAQTSHVHFCTHEGDDEPDAHFEAHVVPAAVWAAAVEAAWQRSQPSQ